MSKPSNPKNGKFSFLETLPHYCVLHGEIREHQDPDLQVCPRCLLEISDEMAALANLPRQGANCPDCASAGSTVSMQRLTGKRRGEVFVTMCYDECCHYPEWYASGRITSAEYNNWINGLTDRQKMGYEDDPKQVKLRVDLNEGELAMMNNDPAGFEQLVESKVKSRAELTIRHDLQRRSKSINKNATNDPVMKRMKKERP